LAFYFESSACYSTSSFVLKWVNVRAIMVAYTVMASVAYMDSFTSFIRACILGVPYLHTTLVIVATFDCHRLGRVWCL